MKIIHFKNWILTFIPLILAGLDMTNMTILGVFIFLDIITGVISSVRLNGWSTFSSRTLSFGIIFKLFIILVPLIVVWAGQGVGFDLHIIAVWSMNILILSEALSILGNIHTIKTGVTVKEVDAVNSMFKKLRSVLVGLLER